MGKPGSRVSGRHGLEPLVLLFELSIQTLQFAAGNLIPSHRGVDIRDDRPHGLSGLPNLVPALVAGRGALRRSGHGPISLRERGEATGEVGNISTAELLSSVLHLC